MSLENRILGESGLSAKTRLSEMELFDMKRNDEWGGEGDF